MSKIVMFESNKDDILNDLFKMRKEKIETLDAKDKKFVKDNNIYAVTEENLIQELQNLNVIDEEKNQLINHLKTYTTKMLEFDSYMQEKYYKTGVTDMMNLILLQKY